MQPLADSEIARRLAALVDDVGEDAARCLCPVPFLPLLDQITLKARSIKRDSRGRFAGSGGGGGGGKGKKRRSSGSSAAPGAGGRGRGSGKGKPQSRRERLQSLVAAARRGVEAGRRVVEDTEETLTNKEWMMRATRYKADDPEALFAALLARIGPEALRGVLQRAAADAERAAGAEELARLELEAARRLLGDDTVLELLRSQLTAAPVPAVTTKGGPRSPVDAIAASLPASLFARKGAKR